MKRVVFLVAVVAALALPALAHAQPPKIYRPDPVTYPLKLDYENPLPGQLERLDQKIIVASTIDNAYLAYEKQDDLGGFMPAPIGVLVLDAGGRNVLSTGNHEAQIPLFQQAAGGKVRSFTFTGSPPTGPTPPPDNGNGNGVVPPPPPTPANSTVPPANQGFGGLPGGNKPGGGKSGGGAATTITTSTTKPTTTKPPPTTTTAPSTTTASPATGGAITSGGGGRSRGCSGGSCAAGSCGTAGIEIDSSPPGCTLTLSNATPGDSVSEVMTITNTTGATYDLSLRATGIQASNPLWSSGANGLQLSVWDVSGPMPASFPTLLSWTTQFWPLTTLAPGASVQYELELFLPTAAGNTDQGKTAVIGFQWHAQG